MPRNIGFESSTSAAAWASDVTPSGGEGLGEGEGEGEVVGGGVTGGLPVGAGLAVGDSVVVGLAVGASVIAGDGEAGVSATHAAMLATSNSGSSSRVSEGVAIGLRTRRPADGFRWCGILQ
jgi:hypothetical protein